METPALTTVPCGGNFSLVLEGRSATVLSIAPLAPGAWSGPVVLGRATRTSTSVTTQPTPGTGPSASVDLVVTGLYDAASPEDAQGAGQGGDCPYPGYLLVPTPLRAAVSTVRGGAPMQLGPLVSAWVAEGGVQVAPQVSGCGGRRAVSGPWVPEGYSALALDSQSPLGGTTFVHSQSVEGMGYNATFAGGVLTGTVQVGGWLPVQSDWRGLVCVGWQCKM